MVSLDKFGMFRMAPEHYALQILRLDPSQIFEPVLEDPPTPSRAGEVLHRP